MPEYYGKDSGDNFNKILLAFIVLITFFSLLSMFSQGTIYPVANNNKEISTGQNANWYFIQVNQSGRLDYVGVSKVNKGKIGLGQDGTFIGDFYLVPAFKHPSNSNWYLCPITNMQNVNTATLGSNYMFFDADDSSLTCYRYDNPLLTGTANVSTQIRLEANPQTATIKLNVNVSIYGISPLDTGFGFMFFPEDAQKFRYVQIGGTTYDLQGVEGAVNSQNVMRFLDSNQNYLSKSFDWSDMLDTGNVFSEILTMDNQKGLLVGTYGYGASNFISIDPIINVSINSTYPSWLLINGSNMYSSNDEYGNKTDITSIISDNNDATSVITLLGGIYGNISSVVEGWSFNDLLTGEGYIRGFFRKHDGAITGDLDNVYSPERKYYGGYFDGTNDYVTVTSSSDFDIPSGGSQTMAIIFNTTMNIGKRTGLINKRLAPSDGFNMWYMSDETIDCVWDGTSTSKTLSSTTAFDDNNIHIVVCKKDGTDYSLWVDGVMEDSATGAVGDVVNNRPLYLGIEDGSATLWEGTIWEVGITNEAIPDSIIQGVGSPITDNNSSIINLSKGIAVSVFFNHTIDSMQNYSLYLRSENPTLSVIRVMSYINMTKPNSTSFHDYVIKHGDNFLLLDNLISIGYNYPFRVWSITGSNDSIIGDIYLYESVTDSEPPSVTDFTLNTTSLTCNEGFHFHANVTDNQAIEEAKMLIDVNGDIHVHYLNHESGDLYFYDYTPSHLTSDMITSGYPFDGSTVNISILQVNATDIVGNLNSTNFSPTDLQVQYSCGVCTEDWVQNPISCMTNDSYLKTYTDSNDCGTTTYLPIDNGTYASCNYCTENLDQITGSCNENDTQPVYWVDYNQTSCCDVTNITADCDILYYPFNETTYISCFTGNLSSQMGNLSCQSEPNFNVREKEYCVAYIPSEYLNESFKCISKVTNGETGEVLQTNPQYTQTSQTLINPFPEEDTREYFTPANSIVNFYYTSKNLHPDNTYVLSIQCSSAERTLTSQTTFQMAYEDLSFVFFRTEWLSANAPYLIAGLLLLFVIIALLLIWWRGASR